MYNPPNPPPRTTTRGGAVAAEDDDEDASDDAIDVTSRSNALPTRRRDARVRRVAGRKGEVYFNAPPAFFIVAIVAVRCPVSESINGVSVKINHARMYGASL